MAIKKIYIDTVLTWCWHHKFGFEEYYPHQAHGLLDTWTEELPPNGIKTYTTQIRFPKIIIREGSK